MRPISNYSINYLDENDGLLIANYMLTQCNKVIEGEDIIVYGIKIETKDERGVQETFEIEDISSQENLVKKLYDLMINEKVTAVTALDIVEDFIN